MATIDEIKNLLENCSKELSTKIHDSADSINKNIDDQIGKITGKIQELEKKVDDQAELIKTQEKEIFNLRSLYLDAEKEHQIDARKRNLILHNIPDDETSSGELKDKLVEIIKQECNIELKEWHFDNYFRLGKKNDNKIRPVLLSLTSLSIKQSLFNKKRDLKNIGMSEDMPKCITEARQLLRPIMENFRKSGSKVYFKQDKLIVDGKEWQDEKITTSKRPREEEHPQDPNNKRTAEGTKVIGSSMSTNQTPKGPRSIQQKLYQYATSPNLNNTLRTNLENPKK